MKRLLVLGLVLGLGLAACGEDGGPTDSPELITTIGLDFTPAGGGATITAEANDPDGPGGEPLTVDPVTLFAGVPSYTLAVRFENRLETPTEDITIEIRDEGDEHQVFFTGDAPLTLDYADADAGGLPIGLAMTVMPGVGGGTLTVTLRHLPPIGDSAVKVAGLAEEVATGGISSIGGQTDATADFPVSVVAP